VGQALSGAAVAYGGLQSPAFARPLTLLAAIFAKPPDRF